MWKFYPVQEACLNTCFVDKSWFITMNNGLNESSNHKIKFSDIPDQFNPWQFFFLNTERPKQNKNNPQNTVTYVRGFECKRLFFFCRTQPLQMVGRISMALYLVHWPVWEGIDALQVRYTTALFQMH